MSQSTTDRPTELRKQGDGEAKYLQIDGETFEAFSGGIRRSSGNEPRVIRWLETWAGTDC